MAAVRLVEARRGPHSPPWRSPSTRRRMLRTRLAAAARPRAERRRRRPPRSSPATSKAARVAVSPAARRWLHEWLDTTAGAPGQPGAVQRVVRSTYASVPVPSGATSTSRRCGTCRRAVGSCARDCSNWACRSASWRRRVRRSPRYRCGRTKRARPWRGTRNGSEVRLSGAWSAPCGRVGARTRVLEPPVRARRPGHRLGTNRPPARARVRAREVPGPTGPGRTDL